MGKSLPALPPSKTTSVTCRSAARSSQRPTATPWPRAPCFSSLDRSGFAARWSSAWPPAKSVVADWEVADEFGQSWVVRLARVNTPDRPHSRRGHPGEARPPPRWSPSPAGRPGLPPPRPSGEV